MEVIQLVYGGPRDKEAHNEIFVISEQVASDWVSVLGRRLLNSGKWKKMVGKRAFNFDPTPDNIKKELEEDSLNLEYQVKGACRMWLSLHKTEIMSQAPQE